MFYTETDGIINVLKWLNVYKSVIVTKIINLNISLSYKRQEKKAKMELYIVLKCAS